MSVIEKATSFGNVKIISKRSWSAMRVRVACIHNDLYTWGDNEAYSKMLGFVDTHAPTTEAMYLVAKDIANHSNEKRIAGIMFILESEAVLTGFKIDDYDEI